MATRPPNDRGDRQGFNRQNANGNQQGGPAGGPNGGQNGGQNSGLNNGPGGNPQDNRPAVKLVLNDYLNRKLPDLQDEAEKLEVRDVKWLKKADLICEILRRAASGRADEIV